MVNTQQNYLPKEYRVYFQIDDINSSSFAYFDGHSGETVRIKDSDIIFGTLGSEFSRGVAVYTYTENMEDGTKVDKTATYPAPEGNGDLYSEERCSISGYIVVWGNVSNNGIFLNGNTYFAKGDVLDIVSEHIGATIRITEISEN